MNNKLLIFALLSMLSACATETSSTSLMNGTGSGAAGSASKSTPISTSASTTAISPYISKPPVLDKSISSKSKSDEVKNIDSFEELDDLAPTVQSRSSNNSSNKNTQANTEVDNRDNYVISPAKPDIYNMGSTHNYVSSQPPRLKNNSRTASHTNPVISSVQKKQSPQLSTKKSHLDTSSSPHVEKTEKVEKIYLQLGVFSKATTAQELQKKVTINKMPKPIINEMQVKGKTAYRVQIGPFFSATKVQDIKAKLEKIGISNVWKVTANKK